MRLIGHLPSENSAVTFSDFLCLHGIQNLVEAEKDGWAVWIHSEDEISKAKDFFLAYLGNPQDPKYIKLARQARQARDQQQRERDAEEGTERPVERVYVVELGPVTLLLILASITFFFLAQFGAKAAWLNELRISEHPAGFKEILAGEAWRVFTPILLHTGILHLGFSLLCLLDLGGTLERRHGTLRLTLLVLLFAGITNVAEYLNGGATPPGLSGVVFGLLGYLWLRSRVTPDSGFRLSPHIVIIMLAWLTLGLLQIEGVEMKFANAAHLAGLIAGIITGYVTGLRRLVKE